MENNQVQAKRSNSKKHQLSAAIDRLIKARFLIALALFIFILVFKIHGSSINMWDQYVSDYTEDGDKQGVILGKPRPIRSDEWMVQTPYSLSQTQTGLKGHNEVITIDGQDMVIGYNSPALNLATLAKPFTWGYVLLGKERGLSWYWGLKLIGLMLLSFEIGLILTKRNKYLALLTSVWIPFSAAIQWWFVSPVGDLVFFTFGFLVGIYNYFYYHENKRWRVLFSLLASICASGFILVLYPALQVPFGYLILFFLIAFFIDLRHKVKLDKFDVFSIGLAVFITGLIVSVSLITSWDSLMGVLHTIYPGNRVSVGGDFAKKDIFLFLTNWKMQFQDVVYSNNSELSSFYHFFFVIVLVSPWLFYKKIKENIYGFLLFMFSLFNLVWMSVRFPTIFAKVTLWSYVPEERAYLAFSFSAILLSIWFIQFIWEQKKLSLVSQVGIIGINLGLYFFALYKGNLRLYLSKLDIIMILLFAGLLIVLLLNKRKYLFSILLVGIVLFTGSGVNPVARGVDAVYEKKIAQTVMEIEKKDPNQVWAGERMMHAYLPMLGVHTFNGTAFTPNLESWKPLDPTGKYEDVYNRYSHIYVEIGNNKPQFELLNADAFVVRLGLESLKKYNIKYLVTYETIDTLATETIQLKQLYGPDTNNAYIYQVIY
ncbi:hypothetical protein UAY_00718 [Enterococcus moraviensis ATCC BAA-383]|uniref:Glycosyltransferase RgtA/B/C/D-like domain-containing protein n=1 Tax=Enterococcus moraviensis ATCC BAA-383 TaxID=1158609 RepID=R2RBE8_9ENTE|nr:hypothetical protein [Enterococcus moraviensis]EOI04946.1 hypothetical protein UAY_00718 [Enterococcus moraviensis ATCC BAA-383]EOT74149.1 hypothetical protein I586_01147 [Enterococcus moraviensis ATCC BAA-383]